VVESAKQLSNCRGALLSHFNCRGTVRELSGKALTVVGVVGYSEGMNLRQFFSLVYTGFALLMLLVERDGASLVV